MDYSSMSDYELDILITKTLGWTVSRMETGFWSLFRANGNLFSGGWGCEQDAWKSIHWSSDLRHAWYLLQDIHNHSMEWGHDDTIGRHILWMEDPQEIAKFICIKWLEWKAQRVAPGNVK